MMQINFKNKNFVTLASIQSNMKFNSCILINKSNNTNIGWQHLIFSCLILINLKYYILLRLNCFEMLIQVCSYLCCKTLPKKLTFCFNSKCQWKIYIKRTVFSKLVYALKYSIIPGMKTAASSENLIL